MDAQVEPGRPDCYHVGVTELPPDLLERVAGAARRHPDLRALILFGSRARGDQRPDSDWDFGYLAGPGLDPARLQADLVGILGTDGVDVVDLDRGSALLRFRAARDGRCLHDADGHDLDFRVRASIFWCDVEPVLRRVYGRTLEDLER